MAHPSLCLTLIGTVAVEILGKGRLYVIKVFLSLNVLIDSLYLQ